MDATGGKATGRVRRRRVLGIALAVVLGFAGGMATTYVTPRVYAWWVVHSHLTSDTHYWDGPLDEVKWARRMMDMGPPALHRLGPIIAEGRTHDSLNAAVIVWGISTRGNRECLPYLDRGIVSCEDEDTRIYLRALRLWIRPSPELGRKVMELAKKEDMKARGGPADPNDVKRRGSQ